MKDFRSFMLKTKYLPKSRTFTQKTNSKKSLPIFSSLGFLDGKLTVSCALRFTGLVILEATSTGSERILIKS